MKVLLFAVSELGTNILKELVNIPQYEVCGLVCNRSNNFDIQEMRPIAKARQIDLYEVENIRDPDFISWVRNKEPDVIVVATFDSLLPQEILSLARIAAVNIHPSYLPQYRGCQPYFWPIANGEKESGVTLHYLSDRFDEGKIISQKKVSIESQDTAGTVLHKQKHEAWTLLRKFLEQVYRTGKAQPGKSQSPGVFVMAPKVKPEDMMIQWSWPTRKIIDLVRALNPQAPAYTFYRGETLGIYQVAEVKAKAIGAPGMILELRPDGPLVETGDGAVVIKVVMVGRRYLLTGRDFQEREKIRVGGVFA